MGRIHSFLLVNALTFVSFVSTAFANVGSSTSTALGTGCTFSGAIATQTGFKALFYDNPDSYGDADATYLANGYYSSQIVASIDNVGIPGQNWGEGDYVVELTGYFEAPESGLYVLHVSISQRFQPGSVIAWLGSQMAFECGNQQIPPNTVDGYSVFVHDSADHVAYLYLDAGVFYPMRIVHPMDEEDQGFQISMDTPSGSITNNWSNYIVQISGIANDPSPPAGGDTTSTSSESTAATLYWTASNTFTSTYLFTTTDSSSVVHVVAESALVIPEQTVVTTDVSSTTTVVTEFTAIDTTPGATPYLTTGNVVLVPRSSAGSDTSSVAAASNSSSGATSNASSGIGSFDNSSSTGGSNTSLGDNASNTSSGTNNSIVTTSASGSNNSSSTGSFNISSSTGSSKSTSITSGTTTFGVAGSVTTSSSISSVTVLGATGFNTSPATADSDIESGTSLYFTASASVSDQSSGLSGSGSFDAYITIVVTQYTTVSCDLYWSGEYEFTTTFVETTTDVSGNPCVVTNFGKVKTGTPTVVGVGVSPVTTIGRFTTVDITSGTSQYVTTGTVIVVPAAVNSASQPMSATSVPFLEDLSNSCSTLSFSYSMLAVLSLCLLI